MINDWITSEIYEMADSSVKWPCDCAGIYAIFSKTTNKRYVGMTARKAGFRGRWLDHAVALRKNRHGNAHLQRSFNKRGEKDFYFVVLEIGFDRHLLEKREYFWINKLESMRFQRGWNIDTYDKMNKRTQTYRPKRKRLTKFEFIDPNGNIVKGENLNAFARKVGGDKSHFHKLHHGITCSYLGYKSANKEFHRKHKVYCLVSPEGEIKEFNNMVQFSRENNLSFSGVSLVLSGKKAQVKGWRLESPNPKFTRQIKNSQYKFVKSSGGVFYKFRAIERFCLKLNLEKSAVYRWFSGGKTLAGWEIIKASDAPLENIIEI